MGKGRGQIEVTLNAGITDDIARDLRKRIQNVSPKVQVRIQGPIYAGLAALPNQRPDFIAVVDDLPLVFHPALLPTVGAGVARVRPPKQAGHDRVEPRARFSPTPLRLGARSIPPALPVLIRGRS